MKALSALVLVTLFQTAFSTGRAWSWSSPCRRRWAELGQRCVGFFPVWSSWTDAKSVCSQDGGELMTLTTPGEGRGLGRLVGVDAAVWLGGRRTPKNDSWFWSDGSDVCADVWTEKPTRKIAETSACMEMNTKSGEVNSAPCGELRFYICASKPGSNVQTSSTDSGLVPGVSLFNVVLGHSSSVMEEILRSSSFLSEVRSGRLSENCLTAFIQQEALYLHRVSSTLEALIATVHEEDEDMMSLLLDIQHHYKTQYSAQVFLPSSSPPPQWLVYALLSFHSVVLDSPVYLLTALSARATLHSFIYETLLPPEPKSGYGSKVNGLYQQWRRDVLEETALAKRYKAVIEEKQNEMDVNKAINVFREHTMNQKGLHKAVDCTEKADEVQHEENTAPPLVEL